MMQLSGILASQNDPVAMHDAHGDAEKLWNAWTEQESLSRCVGSDFHLLRQTLLGFVLMNYFPP